MMISWWTVNGLENHDMEDSQGVFQVLDMTAGYDH